MTLQSTEMALTARRLVRRVGATTILDEVYLEIPKGECVGVIGRSGSGKSSLLRALSLLDPLEDGFVTIAGKPFGREVTDSSAVRTPPRHEVDAMRPRVGLVFQDFQLWPHLSVRENIALPQRITLKRKASAAQDRADKLMAQLNIAGFADQHPAALSGGQKQRVAIARALALDPAVLMFDEPTSALDPELIHDVINVFMALKTSGMTIIVVSHEIAFVRAVADRAIFMHEGKVIADDTPDAMLRAPKDKRVRAFADLVSPHHPQGAA
ncbi:ATP-binding cassette domain-containing protein [Marinovum sp. 2_MG-2023]|uniref:amino acid ABC transporter ATP-binding protein n=1 Tax=unclassified Marinovum TaxID=2647166 RepID=UPI0026E2065D|nr:MULTISPECIES: ATP-binding cassette domain-containing protein [unclassified Marinovum]MDO6731808.1 ATP-binding cassette domain-containing protein [Marinovum sp. 2_MG-2023]MDO6781060.1 ATP-binding cassette domain-containing protein [Marinovum sp. 1_MG-2023]